MNISAGHTAEQTLVRGGEAVEHSALVRRRHHKQMQRAGRPHDGVVLRRCFHQLIQRDCREINLAAH